MDDVFTGRGAWDGSSYELFIELGSRSDARSVSALGLLWRHPLLDGPYAERDREPRGQSRVDPAVFLERRGSSRGILTLGDGSRVACGAFVLRGSRGDWLNLFVPLGSLVRVWPEVWPFPFLDSDEDTAQHVEWQERIESLFVDLARHVFAELPFEFAVIGHELEVGDDDFERWERSKSEIPDDRYQGSLLAGEGGLAWHPPTRRGGWILIADGLGSPSTWSELFSSSDDS